MISNDTLLLVSDSGSYLRQELSRKSLGALTQTFPGRAQKSLKTFPGEKSWGKSASIKPACLSVCLSVCLPARPPGLPVKNFSTKMAKTFRNGKELSEKVFGSAHLECHEPFLDPLRPPQVDLPVLEQRNADGEVAALVQQVDVVDVCKLQLQEEKSRGRKVA